MANCAALGANTVLVQVRPFGDALYPSALFPFSHLCTGTQGASPGFDPLALLLAAAQGQSLAVEAWVNPYRLAAGGIPAGYAATSPATTHPEWVKTTADGQYLDPALPAVREYIAAGLAELCENYPLAGIQFDDYFYPTTATGFDSTAYAAYCQATAAPLPLDAWRRENVNALVRVCWQTVHRYPGVRFGISPQGNPDNNYAVQYSDAALWLSTPGYLDYLLPQLYWGQQYGGGTARFALQNIAATWLALPRAAGVSLYFGLGAFRIGVGDGGGAASLAEWQSGQALAGQVRWLANAGPGCAGVAIYRYGSLFGGGEWGALAAQEQKNLALAWGCPQF
ncbi:MAG: family 10 glycosylhydrolase [Gemmiger sp.]|nr:family 10 glycosylhydrolase [Gemmiger sp.]